MACFEQLVSQAEKNIKLLERHALMERLSKPSAETRGQRSPRPQVGRGVNFPRRTRVVLVQPHLRAAAHDVGRQDVQVAFVPARSVRLPWRFGGVTRECRSDYRRGVS